MKIKGQRNTKVNAELLKACRIALHYMEKDSDDEQEAKDFAVVKKAITEADRK